MKAHLRQAALDLGFDAVGFASAAPSPHGPYFDRWLADGKHGDMGWLAKNPERRKDVQILFPEARSVIAVALNYWIDSGTEEMKQPQAGIVARYARGRDYHKLMEALLKKLARAVERVGGKGTRARIAADTAAVLEREWAQRSGLAWVGKSTMALNRSLGAWFLLGEVITTLELEPDSPAVNRCGSCARCITACPTGAITSPYQLDARRCISYLTIESKGDIPEEYRAAMGNRIFGCDDCLAACPWNRWAREAGAFKQGYRADLAEIDPREILRMTETDFEARFSGTPIRRLGLERLQRNACVALGNKGNQEDSALLRHMAREHPSPLVRRHAEWGAQEVKKRFMNIEANRK